MRLGDKWDFPGQKMIKFAFVFLLLFSLNAGANSNSCVVLLYHNFSNATPKSTSISPELFEQHLRYLQQNDFKVLKLETMIKRLDKGFTDKCVVLTADDAYKSIVENAYPLLQKYQMPMSVFVSTDALDKKYKAMMTWQQVRDIDGQIIQFYNHTKSHQHLLKLDSGQIKTQIDYAQKRLNQELGVRQKIFAYPYGEANPVIIQQLKKLGYIVFGQHSGVVSASSNLQNLPRFPMAAEYAKMQSFKIKVNALPMMVKNINFNPVFTQNPPTLTLEFNQTPSKHQKANLQCFFENSLANKVWQGDRKIKISAKKPLTQRRSKYNCTMPSGQKDKYYWHSVQWINPKIAE
ncbi:MAG: polysaccharide deacetylase family protein [Candidatus Thioglobus sp.]|nr:MAG: polysaccharide deacetylase family protein [Candidatus Thioglobus sp.]